MKPRHSLSCWFILCLLAGALLWAQPLVWATGANTSCCKCSGAGSKCDCDTNNTDCTGQITDCNDPAFIASTTGCGQCKKANASLDTTQSAQNANAPLPQKQAELVASEQTRYQTYIDAVRKNPASAFPETLSLWKSNVSADMQRMSIVHSLGLTQKPEELEALQFMLQALETPEAQRKECARLARGNRNEQDLASKRLMLLASNPKLQKNSANK